MTPAAGHRPVLVIAGSDPSGGAGVEADIKTITALGAYAMTAITALTVQDTQGISEIHGIPAAFVGQQLYKLLADIGADAIKIGMLGSAEMVKVVAVGLQEAAAGVPIVLDPVLAATSGTKLLEPEGLDSLKTTLLPMASLITPNLDEAAALTGREVRTLEDMKGAARALVEMGAGAVLVTGGHLEGDTIFDLLLVAGKIKIYEDRRIDSRHTHGTGCTLSSAIAAGLADGKSLEEAVAEARAFVRRAIAAAPELGSGRGPLGHAGAGRHDG
jgi:hydroxymethylpyrimidine/phosphomethylpyrimidine kinase